jgi:hypothetical protein
VSKKRILGNRFFRSQLGSKSGIGWDPGSELELGVQVKTGVREKPNWVAFWRPKDNFYPPYHPALDGIQIPTCGRYEERAGKGIITTPFRAQLCLARGSSRTPPKRTVESFYARLRAPFGSGTQPPFTRGRPVFVADLPLGVAVGVGALRGSKAPFWDPFGEVLTPKTGRF